MKKYISIIALLILPVFLFSQDKFISRNGSIRIYSQTAAETIDATNGQVASAIDASKGTLAFDVIIKSFKFKKALMEEHFNENYMQSEKFPKSTFKGKFTDFDLKNFAKNGTYNVTVDGDLTIHGVTKKVTQKGTLEVKDGKVTAKSKFTVKVADYGIEIPSVVKDKVASTIELQVNIPYDKK